jgi:hypothetical protein
VFFIGFSLERQTFISTVEFDEMAGLWGKQARADQKCKRGFSSSLSKTACSFLRAIDARGGTELATGFEAAAIQKLRKQSPQPSISASC